MARVCGEIHENIDAIGANGVRELLVSERRDVAPSIDVTTHHAIRAALDEAAFAAAWTEGEAMALEQVIAYAMTASNQEI